MTAQTTHQQRRDARVMAVVMLYVLTCIPGVFAAALLGHAVILIILMSPMIAVVIGAFAYLLWHAIRQLITGEKW